MRKITLKRSRKSFFAGYIFALLFGLIVFSVYVLDIFPMFIIYLLSFPAVYLFILPEYTILNTRYIIKDENVEGVTGIITKKKTIIPWSLVSNVSMRKSLIGMMLDYGDIIVSSIGSERSGIVMRGINDPEKALRKIEEKIGKGKVIY